MALGVDQDGNEVPDPPEGWVFAVKLDSLDLPLVEDGFDAVCDVMTLAAQVEDPEQWDEAWRLVCREVPYFSLLENEADSLSNPGIFEELDHLLVLDTVHEVDHPGWSSTEKWVYVDSDHPQVVIEAFERALAILKEQAAEADEEGDS